jgi:hypothetical protein
MKLTTASDGRTEAIRALGQRRSASDRGGGFGLGEHAVRTVRVRRGEGADSRARSGGGGASEAGCRDVWRAVLTAALNRGVGAVRGSHAAMARCHAGPAQRAASDRWGRLVIDF